MKKKRNWSGPLPLSAAMFAAVLVLGGCGAAGGGQSAQSDDSKAAEQSAPAESADVAQTADTAKLKVEASFYPMYEFARNVGGDLADVESLIPAGVEPHDWEPTPQDIAKIEEADVLVYNGAGMEGWIDQVLDGSGSGNLVSAEASGGIDIMEGSEEEEHEHEHEGEAADAHEEAHEHEGEEAHDHEHGHDHGGLDPHVWLSPALAIEEVRNIEKAFAEASPEHADQFKSNADAYIEKLEALDEAYKSELSDVKRKDFITQHAAFGYLAHEYGLTQVPIAGLSPEQEPSAQQMAEIVEFAKAHQVRTIFFETLVSSKVADTIANELGAKTAVLNPLEGLTDEEIAAGEDYISVMRGNLEALKAALNE
ncbi:metal ABC transporter substrate-binding protein [Saccharibacillus sp. CPCC 101409]|uniref:metal ABC transporter substrate-binding protein n=1 Tax=Saccharibacillus sp. CPCC 101409 TaxID=3058041 RepID=UPI002670D55C|nr:metal ABC transporter substrate-binding protein [Saccharibacillus sp. CPCC 101409]MDO3413331.1 metal ABC transporter substrate-binding protein [Saccharibacillus sp. CPCC 101409]